MTDVVVVGGGIAGLAFAFHAARAGRAVTVIEKDGAAGGCLATSPAGDGFWIELGAHTCYNSYGAFLELVEGAGLLGELVPRGRPVLRFLDGDRVLPGKNLGALLRRMGWWELLRSLPRGLRAAAGPETVREHYGRLVGARNYERVLGPMLSAVPSQPAHDFPSDMMFKKRPRRKDVRRSFTLRHGLSQVAAALAARPGVTLAAGRAAVRVERAGDGFAVVTDDGGREEAGLVALAVPPRAAAALLGAVAPEAAGAIAGLGEATVDSVGVVVRADRVALPYATFLIPLDDAFHSVVTRDVVPHPTRRGFVFHFKPGLAPDERLARAVRLLGVARADLEAVAERRSVMPSPAPGHQEAVAALDRALAGTRLAVTGNWFAGLAIEDCAQRSRGEWNRIAGTA